MIWSACGISKLAKMRKVRSFRSSFLITQMTFKKCFVCFSVDVILSYCWQLESADSDRNSVFCQATKLTDPERFFWHHAEVKTVWQGGEEQGDSVV
jgi:hypothetical protein